jgi:hypothetical protein
MLHEAFTSQPMTTPRTALLMTWAWEAGRRYGVIQAIDITLSTTDDYKASVQGILQAALDATLDLPAPEKSKKAKGEGAQNVDAGATGETGEARSTDDLEDFEELGSTSKYPN